MDAVESIFWVVRILFVDIQNQYIFLELVLMEVLNAIAQEARVREELEDVQLFIFPDWPSELFLDVADTGFNQYNSQSSSHGGVNGQKGWPIYILSAIFQGFHAQETYSGVFLACPSSLLRNYENCFLLRSCAELRHERKYAVYFSGS